MRYLQRCRELAPGLAGFAAGLQDLSYLQDEIDAASVGKGWMIMPAKPCEAYGEKKPGGRADKGKTGFHAAAARKVTFPKALLQQKRPLYPSVKKEYKNKFPGTVVDASSTGATFFIEPAAVSKLREEINHLETEEENEVKIILYTLSALVEDNREAITINLEYMEELDYVFAKGKLSAGMEAREPALNTRRYIKIRNGSIPF